MRWGVICLCPPPDAARKGRGPDGTGALPLLGALKIPEFRRSDRYDGDEVLVSHSFGLEFELARDDPPRHTLHPLSVNSDTDTADFDGSETERDGNRYVLDLLRRAGPDASVRAAALLYG